MNIRSYKAVRLWFAAAIASVITVTFGSINAHAGTTGGIHGYVIDADGHPIQGAAVSAVAPSGRAETLTQAGGFYSMNGLPLDTYTVTFSKDGYLTQAISGITTLQDQSVRASARLNPIIKTLARIRARSATSLVQPAVTSDTYVVNQNQLSNINGTPQDLNGFEALAALPGVIHDATPLGQNDMITIRAGAANDVGYEYDGVDSTNAVNGLVYFLFSPPLNGVHSIQLSTGGYDVSEGNTNSGVINEVVKRGTYPPSGEMTIRLASPIFGHEASLDYGGATPYNRLSYYFSAGAQRDAFAYGDRNTLLPLQIGNRVFQSLNDDVFNLFYHLGRGGRDELQFLTHVTGYTATADYLAESTLAPYPSNNGVVQAASDPFGLRNFSTYQSSYTTLFPGQATYRQDGAPNVFTLNTVVDKIAFKRQLTPSSFISLRLFDVNANHVGRFAYNTGSFTDFYYDLQSTGLGEAADYARQINAQHEFSLGAGAEYYKNQLSQGTPSLEPSLEPFEDLGCSQAANALGRSPAGGCYIAPFNAALNAQLGLGLPTNPALAPLNTYASDFLHANDPLHRWDGYVKDRYQPDQRLTLTLGLRWDKEWIPLPPNAAAFNATYYIDGGGDVVTIPGRPIGSGVTHPSQISPRFAVIYQMSQRDSVRLSYGKNIEFAPLQAVEQTYWLPNALKNCDIDNGCFQPLPGYGKTNQVTNLYQQITLDLNTHQSAQYTPVSPQTAVNLDFSYAHDFGRGLELRVTPYYRKGTNYVVDTRRLLFTMPSGTPVFGPLEQLNAGINKNTGVEFALQRTVEVGLSGLLDATYDNTLANYDTDFFPSASSASLAAGHFIHVTYVAPLTGTLNLVYSASTRFDASMTVSYESGFRYGVGKKTFVFGPGGKPVQVLNTDLAAVTPSQAYYFTDPTNPGTILAPHITGSRGTPEGDDPGTLFAPSISTVNLTLSRELGAGPHTTQVGVRATNLLGNYTPSWIPANVFYVPQGMGGYGPGSGHNVNQCAPGQTFACEPFRYNEGPQPYESEPSGLPRTFTFFLSVKY